MTISDCSEGRLPNLRVIVVFPRCRLLLSQNHKILWAGRDPQGSLSTTLMRMACMGTEPTTLLLLATWGCAGLCYKQTKRLIGFITLFNHIFVAIQTLDHTSRIVIQIRDLKKKVKIKRSVSRNRRGKRK